nr:diguanylate cyclase [Desulfuromonas acetoxidans]
MKPDSLAFHFHKMAIQRATTTSPPSSTSSGSCPWGRGCSFLPVAVGVFGLCLLLAAWILTLNQLQSNRRSLLDRVTTEQHNLVSIISKNLTQAIDEHRPLKTIVRNALDEQDTAELNHIPELLSGQHFFNRMLVCSRNGTPLYQSSPGTNYSEQQNLLATFFPVHQDTDTPFIFNAQLLRPDAPWQIPLVFRIATNRFGSIAMILEADLGYLLNLYQDVMIGHSGIIQIQTLTGQPLVHIEQGALVVEPATTPNIYWQSNRQFGQTKTASYQDHSHLVLTSYRHLSAYPLTISVSQYQDEILQKYAHWRHQQLMILSVVTLLSLVGFSWLVWVAHQKQHYLQALLAANQQNAQLINQLEHEHKQAVDAASRDPLTNLYNRRLFIELAQKQLLYSKRKELLCAVLFLDLDRFKEINDTYGHHIGDLLLKKVADRLRDTLREADIIARYGGDEFVILLDGITRDDHTFQITEKLVHTLSRPYTNLDGLTIHTTPSIGVAMFPKHAEDVQTLLLQADVAMYWSKENGRAQWTLFHPRLASSSTVRHSALKTALKENS